MKLSYPDLVHRLIDLERLAEPPMPGEYGGTATSYNRRSRYDAETDSYLEWDAKGDDQGFVRQEGEWVVAFDREGPGVIWRVWSAMPGVGRIQIFIDGGEEPVVDMPFRDFFDRFNDEIPAMNFPSLAQTVSRGRNRFLPISYNRSCVVRLGPGWGGFYHFTHTTFPSGTEVPSFDGSYDNETSIALATVDRQLAERGWRPPRSADGAVERIEMTVAPGATVPVSTLVGNRAITAIRAQVDLPESPGDRRPLRELALSIHWDGEREPSVWSPFGDFFGSVPGTTYYRALPVGVTDGGFYSHWFMPFSERAELFVTNDGTEPRTLRFAIHHRNLERPASELLRFHAKWHRDAFRERAIAEGRDVDWPLLLTEGQGRFCGISLHVWNPWPEPEQKAATWWYGAWLEKSVPDWWWGEGSEKFFVDGEKFPSSIGTGTEDYIGFAWSAEPPFPTFETPYAAQPYVELDANGHSVVSRFHICDDIPFQERFDGYIERWGDSTRSDSDALAEGYGNRSKFAAVAYWYQRAGGTDPYGPVPLSERVDYADWDAPATH
jgi:hypothetical protein